MRKLLAAVLCVAALVTACQRPTKDLLNVPVTSEADAVQAALVAQARARARGNAVIETEAQFTVEGRPFRILGKGTVDYRRKRTLMIFDVGTSVTGAEGGPTTYAILMTARTMYLGVVPKGKTRPNEWGSIDRKTGVAILTQVSGGAVPVDPGDALLPLRGVRPGSDFVGSEPIGDVQASEFHITIDPNEALRRATTEDEKTTVRQQLFNTGDLLPASVWIGEDGLAHRFRISFGQGPRQVIVTTTLSDYGSAGSVSLPPASQVEPITSPSQLQALFGGATARGDGEPEPEPSASAQPTATQSPSGSASPTPSGSQAPATAEPEPGATFSQKATSSP